MKETKKVKPDYGKERLRLLSIIASRLEKSQTFLEVEEALNALWNLADHGDLEALALYGIAYLMEGKEWYDAEEGRNALLNAAEEGLPMAQYYLGVLLLDGHEGVEQDPVTGKYWLEQSANKGYRRAIEFIEKRWQTP